MEIMSANEELFSQLVKIIDDYHVSNMEALEVVHEIKRHYVTRLMNDIDDCLHKVYKSVPDGEELWDLDHLISSLKNRLVF